VSIERIAARGAAWTIGSSVLSRGFALVGTLILTRFVAPDDYGEVAAATIIVGTINLITTINVGIYFVAKRDVDRADVFHGTLIQAALGLLAFVTLMVAGKPLSPLFGTPNMYRYVPGLALAALVDRVTSMPERILVRELKFRRISLVRSAAELAYTAASVSAAAFGLGGMAIVFGNLARSAVRASGMVSSVERQDWLLVGRIQLGKIRTITRYGLPVTISGLANFASRKWDNLLVSHFFGPAVMAKYNLAYNMADIPAVHVGEQITDVMQAAFAHMPTEERRRSLLRSLGTIGLVTFPIAVGLGVVAPTLSDLFLGKNWVGGVSVMLQVLSVLSLTRPVFGATSSYLLLERGPRVLMKMEWLTLALLMGLIATLGRISPVWTCYAVGIAYTFRAVGGIYLASSVSGTPMWRFFSRLLPPLLACLPLAAGVWGIRLGLTRLGLPTALRLVVEILGGAAVYVVSALVIARQATRDLLDMVRSRRHRAATPVSDAVVSPI
jgi:lipopolysaccharide exporter